MSWVIKPKHRYGKDKIWVHTSKASQYYKGFPKQFRLEAFKRVDVKWNPLNEFSYNARKFQNVSTLDYIAEREETEKCEIVWETHEEDEPPFFTFHVRDDTNTRVVFDASRLDFDKMIEEVNMWGDRAVTATTQKEKNVEDEFGLRQNDEHREQEVREKAIRNDEVWPLFHVYGKGLWAFERRIELSEFTDMEASHWEETPDILFDPGFVQGEKERDVKPLFEFQYTVFDDSGQIWPPPELFHECQQLDVKFEEWRKEVRKEKRERRRKSEEKKASESN